MSRKETTHVNIDGSLIKSSQIETLLAMNHDIEPKFEDQFNFVSKSKARTIWDCSNCPIYGFKIEEKHKSIRWMSVWLLFSKIDVP